MSIFSLAFISYNQERSQEITRYRTYRTSSKTNVTPRRRQKFAYRSFYIKKENLSRRQVSYIPYIHQMPDIASRAIDKDSLFR